MKKYKLFILFILFFSFAGTTYSVCTKAMSSSNYRLEKDSINIGGLDDSESTSYKIFDTIGEVATGESASDNFSIHAGYRQLDENYIAIESPSNIALSPSIGGVTGGVASGHGIWTVKSDSSAGYSLSIKASSTPAMRSGAYSFTDYTPSNAGTPDYTWDIGPANSEFGFCPYNANSQIAKYKNNGSACNTGNEISDGNCWIGLSTTYEQVANKSERTSVDGEETKISFKAEVGGLQAAGIYSATVVVTAVSN